ncbi:MAG: 4-diphosphocytidyl-2C-methyl-D-erythritol kinase [Bacteroidota bacterium]|jgi:4-diphosphocytidyl-2-C-methyl-D-erythritol kinase|nr:4-diphosphocytidyl-2C-methyl-D-erythritol kinase [Bacteroidota bacterium]
MICFPNAKINLGLHVTEKREDGFHNIETVFYPVGWNDALEVVEAKESKHDFNLHLSGLPVSGNVSDNLLYKAYRLIQKTKTLPSLEVYLHKVLPMGAGLGGGSADAAFFINLLNEQFDLKFTETERLNMARQLGSDCAFFIKNKPVLATQKGDVFTDLELDLRHLYIAIIYPNVHSNTKEAYSLVNPQKPLRSLSDIIKQPIPTWKTELVNDFEKSIFSLYPIVEKTKQDLYDNGAIYASMSGSGSAVFGLFEQEPILKQFSAFPHWCGKMK